MLPRAPKEPIFMHELAMFGLPGGWEWILILVIGLLLFGRRLPEVGRSLGQAIVEFKKGVKGVQDEIDDASTEKTRARPELQSGAQKYGQPMTDPANVTSVPEKTAQSVPPDKDERTVSRDDTV